MKRWLLFIVFLLLFFYCRAQNGVKELRGHVLESATGRKMEGIMVTAQPVSVDNEARSDRLLGYAVTKKDGSFEITLNDCPDSLRLTASSLMIQKTIVYIQAEESPIIIRVKEDIQRLSEGKVIAQRIEQRGDTLDYNVASFTEASDRSIGDVLRKLPGIQVLDSGKILYQGMEISKFYVEGLDLLSGRYGLATQNIDASRVASVQVLEHHQPIKVLQDSEVPSAAAINLKLRKSSLGAFFMTGQTGIGLPPLLLSSELQGMRFTENQQNLLLYKYDNTGYDIEREMTSFYGGSKSPVIDLLQADELTVPNIDRCHYLFNNAHLTSLNDLHSLGNSYTLTNNFHFMFDRQQRSGVYEKTLFLAEDLPIRIREDVASSLVRRELSGTSILERNHQSAYLENRLEIGSRWNSAASDFVAERKVAERLSLPSFSAEDQVRWVKREHSLYAHFLYAQQDHMLEVMPVLFEDLMAMDSSATQRLGIHQFQADGHYRRNWDYSRLWHFRLQVGSYFRRVDLQSSLTPSSNVFANTDSLANRMQRTEYWTELSAETHYRKRPISAMLVIPIQLRVIDKKDGVRIIHRTPVYVIPAPRGYIEFNYLSLTARFDVGWNTRFAGISDELTGYIMQSYRQLSRSDGIEPRTDRADARLGFHFHNTRSAWFLSILAGYEHIWRNTLSRVDYSGIVSHTDHIAYKNQGNQFWTSISASADIPSLQGSIKMDASFQDDHYLAFNQGQLTYCTHDNVSISPSITLMPTIWAILKYNVIWRYSHTLLAQEEERYLRLPPIHFFHQSTVITFIPVKGLSIALTGHHYYNNLSGEYPSFWFASACIRYKIKKVEYSLDWTNIFNTQQIKTFTYDDVSSYYSAFTLRPAEVLFKVKISIL